MASIRPNSKILTVWRALLVCAAAPVALLSSLLLSPGSGLWIGVSACWALAFLFAYTWYLPKRLERLFLKLEEDRFILSTGVFQRITRTLPFQNVQFVSLRSSPLHRTYGLVTLVVVAPGGRMAVPGLGEEDARRLAGLLFYGEADHG